jgi:ribosomal protein L35AE/L33A
VTKQALPCTGNQEWNTPARIIEASRRAMGGIDCDPASNDEAQKTVQASVYYTKERSGLGAPWCGRVWLNPPYSSKLLGAFIRAFFREYLGGRAHQACILINNNTDTAGCQSLLRTADAVCFVKGRLRFGGRSAGQPLQGQIVFYFGDQRARFLDAFRGIGVCMESINVPDVDLFQMDGDKLNNIDAARVAFEGRE